MAEKTTTPRTDETALAINDETGLAIHSAIPRMGMSIPMPASTKPPPAPSGQQGSSSATPKAQT